MTEAATQRLSPVVWIWGGLAIAALLFSLVSLIQQEEESVPVASFSELETVLRERYGGRIDEFSIEANTSHGGSDWPFMDKPRNKDSYSGYLTLTEVPVRYTFFLSETSIGQIVHDPSLGVGSPDNPAHSALNHESIGGIERFSMLMETFSQDYVEDSFTYVDSASFQNAHKYDQDYDQNAESFSESIVSWDLEPVLGPEESALLANGDSKNVAVILYSDIPNPIGVYVWSTDVSEWLLAYHVPGLRAE